MAVFTKYKSTTDDIIITNKETGSGIHNNTTFQPISSRDSTLESSFLTHNTNFQPVSNSDTSTVSDTSTNMQSTHPMQMSMQMPMSVPVSVSVSVPIPMQETINTTTKTDDKLRNNENYYGNPTLTSITKKLNENAINNTTLKRDEKPSNENTKNTTTLKKDEKPSNENTKNITTLKRDERQPHLQKPLLSSKKFKMEVSLQNANVSLNELFSSFSNVPIPSRLFNDAKGIIFLTVIKGGIGIGGSLGSGIILCRKNNRWSGPCSISMTGIQIGIDIGIERVDHILLLRDDLALPMFQSKSTWNVGSDISIAAGFMGGEVSIGVIIDDNMTTTNVYSYAIAKGAYVGVSLSGSWIKIRDDWNEQFYGHKINSKEIFNCNEIPKNEEYISLMTTLNKFCGTN